MIPEDEVALVAVELPAPLYLPKKIFRSLVLNMGIIGPCFFLALTMGLHVATGGSFTIGTHLLAYWEAIFYSIAGVLSTVYAFYIVNFTQTGEVINGTR